MHFPVIEHHKLKVFPNRGGILGFNLHKNSLRLSDPAPFYENYSKLFFDVKHLRQVGTEGGEIRGAPFSKKVSFLANIGRCPNFLD